MCADTREKTAPLPDPLMTNAPLEKALAGLKHAVAAAQIEPICTAYLGLRQQAGGMNTRDLIGRVQRDVGAQATEVIVSAFSHRHCMMCDNGSMVCETCDGSGHLGQSGCPSCGGLGIEPCSFCQGSCWPGASQTPPELAGLIDQRRRAHVRKDLDRLEKLPPAEGLVQQLNGHRVGVAEWLFRLRARLNELPDPKGNEQEALRRQRIRQRIDRLLEALKQAPSKTAGHPNE